MMTDEELKELMRLLCLLVDDYDEDDSLDPDGHYAFTVTAFVRPDNPAEYDPNTTRSEGELMVGCMTTNLGVPDTGGKHVEQVCAVATRRFIAEYAPSIMSEAQQALRMKKERLND